MISASAVPAAKATAAAALTATLGLAAACRVVSVWQITGIDTGVAARPAGSRSSPQCGWR
jgi:hypothetical protein